MDQKWNRTPGGNQGAAEKNALVDERCGSSRGRPAKKSKFSQAEKWRQSCVVGALVALRTCRDESRKFFLEELDRWRAEEIPQFRAEVLRWRKHRRSTEFER
jgi:hypothetical protein